MERAKEGETPSTSGVFAGCFAQIYGSMLARARHSSAEDVSLAGPEGKHQDGDDDDDDDDDWDRDSSEWRNRGALDATGEAEGAAGDGKEAGLRRCASQRRPMKFEGSRPSSTAAQELPSPSPVVLKTPVGAAASVAEAAAVESQREGLCAALPSLPWLPWLSLPFACCACEGDLATAAADGAALTWPACDAASELCVFAEDE